MNWWRSLLRRRRVEEQLDKELSFHLAQHTGDLIARGIHPDEARRLARLTLGGPEQVKEQCRDARGTRWLEDLWRDLRYALRTLQKKPGLAAVALLTQAFGTAAVSTVSILADTLFLRSLPVEHPDGVVAVQATRRHGQRPGWVSYPEYIHFRDQSKTLQGLAAHYSTAPLSVTYGQRSRELNGAVVSANVFPLLGIRPALGRFFRPDEDRVPDRDRVAVVSYSFWRDWLGAAPGGLGATVKINGVMFTVIGVAPPEFRGVTVSPDEIYIPLMMARAGYRWCTDALARDCTTLDMIGRLAAGYRVEQARAEMATLLPPWWDAAAEGENSGMTVFHALGALHPDLTRGEQLRFVEILSGVAVVLLLVCSINLAGLLMARNSARTREFATRASMGAGRLRLTRQLMAEPLLLAAVGGAIGLLISLFLTDTLNALFYSMDVEGHPLYYNFSPEPRVILGVAVTSMGVGLLAGLIPAWRFHRTDAAESLKRESASVSARPRVGIWLAAAQGATAVALSAVAGLLMNSANTIISGTNFQTSHVALMRLRPRLLEYPPQKAQRFLRTVMERLAESPAVESASMVGTGAVLLGLDAAVSLRGWQEQQELQCGYIEIGPRYFETLRTPLLRGREFDSRDTLQSPPVAIISDSLARRLWPAGGAMGATVIVNREARQVVGMVADVPLESRGTAAKPYVFTPFWQNPVQLDARLAIRVKGDPAAALPALARVANAVDPDVPIAETITLPQRMEGSLRTERVTGAFISYAALLAVLLSGIGLYGTLAFSVSRRTREVGIRLAIGAKPAEVRMMVIREGMAVIGAGLAIGVVLATAGSRVVRHLLYGPAGNDAAIYAAATLMVAGVSLLACWIPARRASRVDPVSALRQE